MESAYDGRQVVGMDVHRRRSVLVRMTGDGRLLGTARITNSPAGLRPEIARSGRSPRVVLAKLGIPVACTHIFGATGSAWLDQLRLPQPPAGKVTSLRQLAAV